MEAFAAVFKDIYTTFLLRDFAGKVVPGIVLLISVATLYIKPSRIVKFLSVELSTPLIFFIGGLAWILILGLQGITNAMKIWRYYPEMYHGKPIIETEAQLVVQNFIQIACQADRQQYERLVVIKEATGNLFAVSCICMVVGLVSLYFHRDQVSLKTDDPFDIPRNLRAATFILVFFIFLIGLKLMNNEHVYKQYDFAASFVAVKHLGCPVDEKAEKKA